MKVNATHKVHIEVMPLFAGHLPYPKIKVLRYLPHTAAVAIQPDPGKNNHRGVIIGDMLTFTHLNFSSSAYIPSTSITL